MVRDTGGKGEKSMKNKIKYTDEPMGKLRVVKDFLPPPNQLALKEETIKVTIALKRSSVDYFKKEAKKNHTSYQKMIRQLLESISERSPTGFSSG
jgi:predicted DNA binding CopG/RHH family protein